MKIGIDLRICEKKSFYGAFVKELVSEFIKNNSDHEIVLFTSKELPSEKKLFAQRNIGKFLNEQKFSLMIFFTAHIPKNYSGEYILILESLKEVFFPKKDWLGRKIHEYELKRALAKCHKVLALDSSTAIDLNELLDIKDEKIEILPAFFPDYPVEISPVTTTIKTRHNLQSDYLIYDSGNEAHNNFERILKMLKTLREKDIFLYLLVLCEETTKDIDIRAKVIEYNMGDQTLFLGNIPKAEEWNYYTQSAGVIFASIYESFPFQFTKALAYNARIFANNIHSIKSIMGKRVVYLDPLSVHTMCDTLVEHLSKDISQENMHISDAQKAAKTLWEKVLS